MIIVMKKKQKKLFGFELNDLNWIDMLCKIALRGIRWIRLVKLQIGESEI